VAATTIQAAENAARLDRIECSVIGAGVGACLGAGNGLGVVVTVCTGVAVGIGADGWMGFGFSVITARHSAVADRRQPPR
jgi:hypothetical protein